ncbi:hypothetical protein PQQ86_15660 [Paraburkholderia sediminicola]|uniref:hypothetical protein n=1 Tax=Paraburkholderia sediminicola TaxID=458836 RepID=UPI0038B93514
MASNPYKSANDINTAAHHVTVNALPSPPDWKTWREKGGGRLWVAVLLSMNVNPTVQNRHVLRANDAERYKEYRRRCEVAIARYSVHEHLPAIEHLRAGKNPGDRFVMFDKFLAFAKDIGWNDLSMFEAGLSSTEVALATTASSTHSLEDAPKGERYDLVRMGALLTLLEKALQGDSDIDRALLISGGKLNKSQIAKEVNKIVASTAKRHGKPSISGFGAEANRKRFRAAAAALDDFFRID